MAHFFKRFFGKIFRQQGLAWLLSLGCAVSIFFFSSAAMATETLLQWQGEKGYQVQAHLTYPDQFTTGMAAIEGVGKPQHLEALTVEIYHPNGKPLAFYNNVVAGQSGQDDFLQLHFDVAQQTLRGWLDLGGAVQEDYFLKGQTNLSIDLFYLDANGKETKLDHNDGQVSFIAEFD